MTALIDDSTIGLVGLFLGSVFKMINGGEIAGAVIEQGSLASIEGASVTANITLAKPAYLQLTQGIACTLNSNTVFLCGNSSDIDSNIAATGTISNACN